MNKADKLLYQENKAGSNLVVIFVVLNMAYTIFSLRVMPLGLNVGIFIMYNIIISLVAFLGSTRMLVYSKNWGYAGLVIALIQCFRVLLIPAIYEPSFRVTLSAVVIISAILLTVGSVITIHRATLKNNYEASLKAQ